MMLFSTIRFVALGWIEAHYITPSFHFHYYGFDWVQPMSVFALYAVHGVMIISACFVIIGLFYRLSAILLFVTFTYTELIDLTYYLNHYYLVTILCFLLILVPANRDLSVDVWLSQKFPKLFKVKQRKEVSYWAIFIFQLQIAIVYGYAGLAKINYDWLIEALPLKIWLPAHSSLVLIGPVLKWHVTAYVFSWVGMLYDTFIIFFLAWPRTRLWAFITVAVFHLLTAVLFQIGVFPLFMVGVVLLFFSPEWHENLIQKTKQCLGIHAGIISPAPMVLPLRHSMFAFLILFFSVQLLFPWRYVLYPGNIFWTEEGYRFSWRVMLMEKTGTAQFYVKDTITGREGTVVNSDFLNVYQENQMSTQPDMILQFARHLKKYYEAEGIQRPAVRAEVYVTLNGKPSQLLFDPRLDLTTLQDNLAHKSWLLTAPHHFSNQ